MVRRHALLLVCSMLCTVACDGASDAKKAAESFLDDVQGKRYEDAAKKTIAAAKAPDLQACLEDTRLGSIETYTCAEPKQVDFQMKLGEVEEPPHKRWVVPCTVKSGGADTKLQLTLAPPDGKVVASVWFASADAFGETWPVGPCATWSGSQATWATPPGAVHPAAR